MSTNSPEFISASAVLRMLPFPATRLWLDRQSRLKTFPPMIRVSENKRLYERRAVEEWIKAKFSRDSQNAVVTPERPKRTPRVRS
jgi:hypothetical protein